MVDQVELLHSTIGFLFGLHALLAVTYIGAGGQIQHDYLLYETIHGSSLNSSACISIVNGVLVFLLSSVPLVAIFFRRFPLLKCAGLVTILSFVVNLIAGIWLVVLKGSFAEHADAMIRSMRNSTLSHKSWNLLQRDFRCCGTWNSTDWEAVLGPNTYPDSCCIDRYPYCGNDNDGGNLLEDGCLQSFDYWLIYNQYFLGVVLICVACFNAVFLAFPIVLEILFGTQPTYY